MEQQRSLIVYFCSIVDIFGKKDEMSRITQFLAFGMKEQLQKHSKITNNQFLNDLFVFFMKNRDLCVDSFIVSCLGVF